MSLIMPAVETHLHVAQELLCLGIHNDRLGAVSVELPLSIGHAPRDTLCSDTSVRAAEHAIPVHGDNFARQRHVTGKGVVF